MSINRTNSIHTSIGCTSQLLPDENLSAGRKMETGRHIVRNRYSRADNKFPDPFKKKLDKKNNRTRIREISFALLCKM